jgi:hypothetical protein
MTDSDELAAKHARNRQERHKQIREWAAYVRTHPDEEWGRQVNTVVDAQLQSARHFEHDRPSIDELRSSPLFDE